jgi:pyruvate dehydrogenase E2 component (dihydrolipoamide acetyltransferase)
MAKIIGLPKLSPTMDEGTLVRWVKNEGDSVDIDELLAEVETDKATMEFRSFDRGVLLKQLAPEGAVLQPDAPVAIIGNKGEDIKPLLASLGSKTDAAPAPKQEKAAETDQPASSVPAQSPPSVQAAAPRPTPPTPTAVSSGGGGKAKASPLVRRLAIERGIDLGSIRGSGPNGRIVKRDLQGIASGGYQIVSGPPRIEPLTSMRKVIARRLTESKREVPHFYLTVDVDAAAVSSLRQQINKELEARGQKVSVNDLIVKAAALALRKVPQANASFMGDSLHYHNRVDISVAVAIPEGLLTPVVRSADTKPLVVIAQEIRELAARAKDKKLTPEEMQNGTFSVSNLGMYGIESFSAVINPLRERFWPWGLCVRRFKFVMAKWCLLNACA